MQRAQIVMRFLCLIGAFVCACGEPTESSAERVLVSPDAWTPTNADDDPFVDRPADAACPSTSMEVVTLPEESAAAGGMPGEKVFEVHTGECNYLTARQSTLEDVSVGQTIRLHLWHFALLSPEPAEAHVAVQIGDTVVWEQRLKIPQAAGLVEAEWKANQDFPNGTPIFFHLHNHGANTWALWKLDVP